MDSHFAIDCYEFDAKEAPNVTKVLKPLRLKRKYPNEWAMMRDIRALDPFQSNLNIVFVL